MKKYYILIFGAIFFLGFYLRTMYLPQKALTFGYDQARDAIHAIQIAQGDLKILGPSASTPGLYHGVFYYYVLSPAYLIGNGDPIFAAYWIAFLNMSTVFIVFYLTFLMTKKVMPAMLASFLFAISFENTQYAVWLSNPTLGVWTVPLAYLGLWIWLKEKKLWGAALAGIGLGLSIQSEIFLAYHAVPALVWIFIFWRKITWRESIYFVVAGLLSVSTLLLSEFKFGFRGISGALSLLSTKDQLFSGNSLGDYLLLFLNQIGRTFAFSTYPGNIFYGSMFVFFLIYLSLREYQKQEFTLSWQPFLTSWLLCHITVVAVGGVSTPFLLVGIAPAISILVGIWLWKFWYQGLKWVVIVLLIILAYGNLSMIIKENPKGQTIFSIQKDMLLSKQLTAIDYTYKESNGAAFSINSVTSPLWINIVWTYLYDWYGKPKYGYVPTWHGRDQVGLITSLVPGPRTDVSYLILEPPAGIPTRFYNDGIYEEEANGKLLEDYSIGELRVQKRQKHE